MPVDPELVTDFVIDDSGPPRIALVSERGEMLTGKQASLTTPGSYRIEGYSPHWASCTDPNRWKRKVAG